MKIPKQFYRLEFNPEKQQWHHDNFTHTPDTFGWHTIADREENKKIVMFCRLVDYNFKQNERISVEFVKKLWDFFSSVYVE